MHLRFARAGNFGEDNSNLTKQVVNSMPKSTFAEARSMVPLPLTSKVCLEASDLRHSISDIRSKILEFIHVLYILEIQGGRKAAGPHRMHVATRSLCDALPSIQRALFQIHRSIGGATTRLLEESERRSSCLSQYHETFYCLSS